MTRTAVVAVSAGILAMLATSASDARHQAGHTGRAASGVTEVKVVRHSFPVTDFAGGQWETSSDTWVNVPGASVNITVPEGERALIVVRFSPSVICSGSGICESRVLIGDVEAEPAKPVYFNSGSSSHWGVMYTERSLGPLEPGTYTVKGQVLTTYGLSGTTLYVRSFHLTVESFRD